MGWDFTTSRVARTILAPTLLMLVRLILLNLVMYWAMAGNLAWEAHLGGFLTGWITGWAAGTPDSRITPKNKSLSTIVGRPF
jgi:membrane associated rhomboid family serine protease